MVEIVTEPTESPSLFFVGDVAKIDDSWDSLPLDPAVQSFIDEADFALANLEGSLPTGDAISKQGPNLEIDRTTLTRLDQMGFDGVSLANNHVMDFGVEGMRSTIEACQEVGLDTVGAGEDSRDAIDPIRCEIDGTSVGIFAVSEHEELNATSSAPGTSWARTPTIAAEIERLSRGFDISILVPHGGIEYVPIPPPAWRRLLRGFASLSIDAVIAHHPHCPQGWEVFEGTPIFYSLGNFMMLSRWYPASKRSFGIEVTLDESGVSNFNLAPFEVDEPHVRKVVFCQIDDFHKYLHQTTETLSNNYEYDRMWNSLSNYLYNTNYQSKIDDFGRSFPSSLLSNPVRALDRLTKWCFFGCAQKQHEQAVRDILSNESHRDVIKIVLEENLDSTRAEGERADFPVPDEWYPYYDGRQTRRWMQRQIFRIKKVMSRLT